MAVRPARCVAMHVNGGHESGDATGAHCSRRCTSTHFRLTGFCQCIGTFKRAEYSRCDAVNEGVVLLGLGGWQQAGANGWPLPAFGPALEERDLAYNLSR